MRISFERSGGFAGNIRFRAEADTTSRQLTRGAHGSARPLSADEAQRLEELVRNIDFAGARSHGSGNPLDRDHFGYSLTVETDDGQRHSLQLGEQSDEGPIADLISHLTKLSKER